MGKRIKLILTLLLLGAGGYYLSYKDEELSRLRELSLAHILIALGVIFFHQVISALKFNQIFCAFHLVLTPKEWFGLPQIRKSFNLFVFKSGTITNAYYLKKRHGLPYSKFIVAFSAEKIIDVFAASVAGLIVSLALFFYFDVYSEYMLAFPLLLILPCFFFFFPFRVPKAGSRIVQNINKMVEAWNEFRGNRSTVLRLFFLETASIYVYGMRIYIASNFLIKEPISFFDSAALAVVIALSGFIALLPGNIGIREGAVGLVAVFLGYRFDILVIATVLDRILATLVFGTMGIIFFYILPIERKSDVSMMGAEEDGKVFT